MIARMWAISAVALVCCVAVARAQPEQPRPGAGAAAAAAGGGGHITLEQRAAWLEADQKLPQALPEKDLVELIDMLDDDSFEVREAGTTALMLRQDFDDIHMVGALRGAKGAEMRHRLIEVAMHRYFQRMNPTQTGPGPDHASLGVDIEPRNIVRPDQLAELKHPAMLIGKTKPGFPAFALLRPGDLVVSIGGKLFADDMDQGDFIATIQQYAPGDVMQLQVIRHDKRIDVPVRLDSYRRLDHVHARLDVPDPAMYAPWQVYLANMLDADDRDPVIRIEYPKREAPAATPAAK